MAKNHKLSNGPELKDRALYLYIAGDNDLSEFGIQDLDELTTEGSATINDPISTHVAVEIDTRGEHTGSIRYEITPRDFEGKSHRIVIERLGERDSGSPKTLRSFLTWAHRRYPAPVRIVVVGGHGNGFRVPRRAIGNDEIGSSLDMSELAFVFEKSQISAANPVSILGFDACLMCMLEVVNLFAPYAKYIVGSQQTEPGAGWPYDSVLKALKSPAYDTEQLAKQIPIRYAAWYRRNTITNITQSAIDTGLTGRAIALLHKLGGALLKLWPTHQDSIRRARGATQSFAYADYVDGVHLTTTLEQFMSIPIPHAKDFRGALKNAILINRKHGPRVRYANGLSIWFPESHYDFVVQRTQYTSLAVTKGPWLDFLERYHS